MTLLTTSSVPSSAKTVQIRSGKNAYVCVYVCGRARVGRIWLRHCATSRKVAGSIPDSVIEIFH